MESKKNHDNVFLQIADCCCYCCCDRLLKLIVVGARTLNFLLNTTHIDRVWEVSLEKQFTNASTRLNGGRIYFSYPKNYVEFVTRDRLAQQKPVSHDLSDEKSALSTKNSLTIRN